MALDPSIILGAQPIKIDNPLLMAGQVAQLQQAQNQNRLADLVFGEKQREVQQSNALNDLYKSAVGADGQIDRTKLYTGAAQSGLGAKLPAIQKGFADMDKAAVEAEKAKLDTHLKKFEMAGQIMAPVKDQATWEMARQQTAQVFGPEAAAQMPAVYDPALVEQKRQQAMTVKDQLEQKWKALDYQLNVDKFGETTRHNKATEATAQGQLGVSQAQLGVSRERLNFEKQNGGKPPAGYRWAPDGQSLIPIPGGPAEKDKLNEGQGKATAYAARMQNADQTINDLIASGTKTPSIASQIPGGLGNLVSTPKQQKMEQAQRDFVNAVLRQESGASISPAEFDNARRQYFPQIGDSADVIAQKAKNRAIAIAGMKTQAGPGAKSVDAIANTQPQSGGIKFLGFE